MVEHNGEVVRAERDGPVLRLTLNRPEQQNRITYDMIRAPTQSVRTATKVLRRGLHSAPARPGDIPLCPTLSAGC